MCHTIANKTKINLPYANMKYDDILQPVGVEYEDLEEWSNNISMFLLVNDHHIDVEVNSFN